ncbi:MAG TPA: hypothetical protein VH305_06640 [Gaiella sp.]|jgi:hypothetical protein
MTLPEAVSNKLIGALFVERGLVSQSQLVVALELQQETGQQLGQILVERFGVERADLAKVVAEHWARMGEAKEEVSTHASESWRQLGEILVSRGFVTHEQLVQALDRQRLTGEKLGEALVGQGLLSKFELAGSLAEQASLVEVPDETKSEPAPVLQLTPRPESEVEPAPVVEAVSGPVLVPPLADEPPPPVVEPEPAAEPEEVADPGPAATLCVAFASTPRGYRLVDLEDVPLPGVGEHVELPELGELVVLRHGVSPLPADERLCVFLEPRVPVAAH